MSTYFARVDCRMAGEPRYSFTDSQEPFMRVPDEINRCVVFIGYKLSKDKEQYIGTGFMVSIPSAESSERQYIYIVTAKHVIHSLEGMDIFVQFLSKAGKVLKFSVPTEAKWVSHPDENVDVAAISIGGLSDSIDYTCLEINMLLDQQKIKKYAIGIGDEVIVAGLFTRLNETIDPIIRVGNLAMLPKGKAIRGSIAPGKVVQMDGYLIDQRSLGGMSGCPVFIRETINLPNGTVNGEAAPFFALGRIFLLGLMRGHWEIDPSEANKVYPNKGDFPMGLSIVIPSEKIIETLNQPLLKNSRDVEEEKIKQNLDEMLSDTPTSIQTSGNPNHKEDFNSLLDAAVRGKK